MSVRVIPWMREDAAETRANGWDGLGSMRAWVFEWCRQCASAGFEYFTHTGARSVRYPQPQWAGKITDVLDAAQLNGLKVFVQVDNFECGFQEHSRTGLITWHDWNGSVDHCRDNDGAGDFPVAQHHDSLFADELMGHNEDPALYHDAFAGFVSSEAWRWTQGMADFCKALRDYTGREFILPVPTGAKAWWYDWEFSEDPKWPNVTPALEAYWMSDDADYRAFITALASGPLCDEHQAICQQGPAWDGGQVTIARLQYAVDAGFNTHIIYDDGTLFVDNWSDPLIAELAAFGKGETPADPPAGCLMAVWEFLKGVR